MRSAISPIVPAIGNIEVGAREHRRQEALSRLWRALDVLLSVLRVRPGPHGRGGGEMNAVSDGGFLTPAARVSPTRQGKINQHASLTRAEPAGKAELDTLAFSRGWLKPFPARGVAPSRDVFGRRLTDNHRHEHNGGQR